jgi:hypothetical protein
VLFNMHHLRLIVKHRPRHGEKGFAIERLARAARVSAQTVRNALRLAPSGNPYIAAAVLLRVLSIRNGLRAVSSEESELEWLWDRIPADDRSAHLELLTQSARVNGYARA